MTPTDPSKFLHSLAVVMAAAAGGLVYAASASARALWLYQADEAAAGDPYSVLSIYGGPAAGWNLQPRCSIQCKTVGTSKVNAMARAQLLYETLLDASGYARRMWRIAGLTTTGGADGHYTLVSVDPLGPPGLIGMDDRNRAEVVFNFDTGFFKDT